MTTPTNPTGAITRDWVLVPREPTPEMLEAFWLSTGESHAMRARTEETAKRRYDAMISAAPSLDLGGGEEKNLNEITDECIQAALKVYHEIHDTANVDDEPGDLDHAAMEFALFEAEKVRGAFASQTGLLPNGSTASRSSGFAAAIPSRGWSFDMDAAPRDGTKVDLMFPAPRGRMINCLWQQDDFVPEGMWIWRRPKWDGFKLLPEAKWDINCYPNMRPYAWRLPDEPPAPKIEARRAEMRSSSVEDESLVTEGQALPSNHSNDITGAGHEPR